jgi:hypothetical protein
MVNRAGRELAGRGSRIRQHERDDSDDADAGIRGVARLCRRSGAAHRRARGRPGKSVDIKSPLGDVSVRTDVKNLDTGLPVYPGAQPLREHGEHESANVNVDSRWFGVKVIAAKYESDMRRTGSWSSIDAR